MTNEQISVLVLDDNRQMRALTRSLLKAAGIDKVFEAGTAEEAFDLLKCHQVDLLLVDWEMQPVNGLEFTLRVRRGQDSRNPYVPVLMMTAHTEESRVAAARDAGVNGYLRKPVSTRLLFQRLQNALLDRRAFVKTATYFGPDRRYGRAPNYAGPFRRSSDLPGAGDDTFDLDDLRQSA